MTQLFNIIAFIVAADKRVAVRSTNIVVAAASAEADSEFQDPVVPSAGDDPEVPVIVPR